MEFDVDAFLKGIKVDLDGFEKVTTTRTKQDIRRSTKKHNKDAMREIAQSFKIPQRVLKHRLKTFTRPQGARWFVGIDSIKAIYLGSARQTKKGVSVGGRSFSGAFLATVRGKKSIYKRTTKDRFPIKEQKVSLSSIDDLIRRQVDQLTKEICHASD